MYPSFEFGARRLRSVHPRCTLGFWFLKKYAHQNYPLNQGNLHELKLRLKIVRYPGIEVVRQPLEDRWKFVRKSEVGFSRTIYCTAQDFCEG